MELVSHLPFLSLTSHILSFSFKGHSEFILLYILPVLDKYHLINLTHEPLRVTSSWLAPQIIIDPRTVSCRYWGNTSTRTSDMGKNTFIIVCAVHVRYGFEQELNHAFFCTTYFEHINKQFTDGLQRSCKYSNAVVLYSLHVHCNPVCRSSVFQRYKCFTAPHWDKTGSDNDMV